jgi:hypothetical protein
LMVPLGFISSLPRLAWDKRLSCCCCLLLLYYAICDVIYICAMIEIRILKVHNYHVA